MKFSSSFQQPLFAVLLSHSRFVENTFLEEPLRGRPPDWSYWLGPKCIIFWWDHLWNFEVDQRVQYMSSHQDYTRCSDMLKSLAHRYKQRKSCRKYRPIRWRPWGQWAVDGCWSTDGFAQPIRSGSCDQLICLTSSLLWLQYTDALVGLDNATGAKAKGFWLPPIAIEYRSQQTQSIGRATR